MPEPLVFLNEASAAALLHLSPRTLESWRAKGGGPPFVRIGSRRVGYRRTGIERWAESRTFTSRAAELASAAS